MVLENKANFKEAILKAKILSSGIGIGKPIFLNNNSLFETSEFSSSDINKEISKFKKALKKAKKQISELKKSLSKDNLKITFDILNTHLAIIEDPDLLSDIIKRIKKHKKPIESVFSDIILEYKNKIKDPFFREKALDLADVFKRILTNIKSIKLNLLKKTKSNSIIISDEIIPSDIIEMDSMNVSAIITSLGNYESHSSIIARSQNIPVISNIDIEKIKKINFQKIIVDGNLGKLILNPSKKTLKEYSYLKNNIEFPVDKIKLKKQVSLYANITNINEIEKLKEKRVKGIGLLRTELLFLENKTLPCFDIQYEIYKEIIDKLKKHTIIIRLFDLGGDKPFYNVNKQKNLDFFGIRGVRFLLKNKKILQTQIKAILKAAMNNKIHILIPFISNSLEIKSVKDIIFDVQKETNLFPDIKIGSMIETPSAAITVEEIIKQVDFVSIGSNDLTRYTLASSNLSLERLDKSIEILIKNVVKVSKENKKPIYICGEMLANKKIMDQLIKIGITNFSIGLKHLDMFE